MESESVWNIVEVKAKVIKHEDGNVTILPPDWIKQYVVDMLDAKKKSDGNWYVRLLIEVPKNKQK